MEKILKNININDFKNYSLNPNLEVWDLTDDGNLTKIPNIIVGNNTKVGNGDYTIAANLKISFKENNPYYRTTEIVNGVKQDYAHFSFYDCNTLFNDLHSFQTTMNHLCSICSTGGVDQGNLSQFIDSAENWYYKEGDRLYPYLYFLLTDKFKEEDGEFVFENLTYLTITTCFWDYFKDNIRDNDISIRTPIGNSNIDLNANILENHNNFIENYIITEGKIGQIVDLIYDYLTIIETRSNRIITLRDRISNIIEYDIYTDIKNQCYDFVIGIASDYFREHFTCDTTTIIFKNYIIQNTYKFDDKPPILKLPVLLYGNIDDIGITTNTAEEWIPGKRYYLGDTVIYDGQMYILGKVNNNGYFAGTFNEIENIIYFDDYNVTIHTGLFNGFKIDDVGNFEHWRLTVNNDCIEHIVKNETESFLYTLKGLISYDNLKNFFDIEGKYVMELDNKPVYRNIKEIGVVEGAMRCYASRILSISSIKYYNANNDVVIETPPNNVFPNNKDARQEGVDRMVINGEIVRREIEYRYIIDEIIPPLSQTGFRYTDTINSDVINAAMLEWSPNTVTTELEYTVYSYRYSDYWKKTGENTNKQTNPSNPSFPAIHSNNELWVETPLIKEEYLFGINGGKPRVEDNINIERGIVYSQDRHMALGEIKTFSQLLTYNNGSFWRVFDNTKRNSVEEGENTDVGALLGIDVDDDMIEKWDKELRNNDRE